MDALKAFVEAPDESGKASKEIGRVSCHGCDSDRCKTGPADCALAP